jgi:hypothetical protein
MFYNGNYCQIDLERILFTTGPAGEAETVLAIRELSPKGCIIVICVGTPEWGKLEKKPPRRGFSNGKRSHDERLPTATESRDSQRFQRQ